MVRCAISSFLQALCKMRQIVMAVGIEVPQALGNTPPAGGRRPYKCIFVQVLESAYCQLQMAFHSFFQLIYKLVVTFFSLAHVFAIYSAKVVTAHLLILGKNQDFQILIRFISLLKLVASIPR